MLKSRPKGDVFKVGYGLNRCGYQEWIRLVSGCLSYRAYGRKGQFIVVLPVLDLIYQEV